MRAGYVYLNYPDWDTFAPFGALQSGNGREYGDCAIHDFLEIRSIIDWGRDIAGAPTQADAYGTSSVNFSNCPWRSVWSDRPRTGMDDVGTNILTDIRISSWHPMLIKQKLRL